MAYNAPTAADLIARYPAFAAVAVETINVHLADAAASDVDTTWAEADYAPAIAAAAAHRMALLGIGESSEVQKYARAGVTGIRTGNFSANFSDAKVAKASGDGFDATPYGHAYKVLLKKNKGGPRIIGARVVGGGFGPLAQQNDGGILPWAY